MNDTCTIDDLPAYLRWFLTLDRAQHRPAGSTPEEESILMESSIGKHERQSYDAELSGKAGGGTK